MPRISLLHPPQPRRIKLQPDDEQQQGDAQLRDAHLGGGIAGEAQHLRPDDDPREEVAQRCSQAEPAEQQHEAEREPEQKDAFAQQGWLDCLVHGTDLRWRERETASRLMRSLHKAPARKT
jgi:hypothetical protein